MLIFLLQKDLYFEKIYSYNTGDIILTFDIGNLAISNICSKVTITMHINLLTNMWCDTGIT